MQIIIRTGRRRPRKPLDPAKVREGFAKALAAAPPGGSTITQLAAGAKVRDALRFVTWLRATRDTGLTVSPANGTFALAPGVKPGQVVALLDWLARPPVQGPSS